MKLVGIIPARSGSRRIPHKNLAPLGGRPLISYTCRAALESTALDAVYVNTDCPRIAAVAAEYGVRCPVLRPARLARDDTPTRDANRFLLEHLQALGERFDAVVVLQPTSPLRSASDIREAVELWRVNPADAVVSVSPIAPVDWCGTVRADEEFRTLAAAGLPTHDSALRAGGVLHRLNGAVYVYPLASYLLDRPTPRTLAHVMPASRGVDIDYPEDMQLAEALLETAVAHAG
ncbi:MAG: acylneuraminate cytidylyltransferase family protein [Phycisphaerales bacterium]|nr:acylneuraminate cytidylyltransferase family protein [Phycisphaerales bacterium]